MIAGSLEFGTTENRQGSMVSVLGASRLSLPRWCDFVIRDVCVLGLTEYHTVCDLKLCLLLERWEGWDFISKSLIPKTVK